MSREIGLIGTGLVCVLLGLTLQIQAQNKSDEQHAVDITKRRVFQIGEASFPEIKLNKIHIKTFTSDSGYFKARFSVPRFFTLRRMRHVIYVNPRVYELGVTENGVRAIIAHELAHVLYYTKKNRIQLLGLARLVSERCTSRFERKADIEAISRGYGPGLVEYRKWLYKNIGPDEAAKKKRIYFSPEELNLMLETIKEKPAMINIWRKRVPENLEEIKSSVRGV